MRKKTTLLSIFILGGFSMALLFNACKKKQEFVNPYDQLEQPDEEVDPYPSVNNEFAKVHQQVFKPQCALSGCHDGGMFPPDFRTMHSTYNTMVYEAPIINNLTYDFRFRVYPGKADSSVVYQRIAEIDPYWSDTVYHSGPMPAYPPDQQELKNQVWTPNKATYIQMVKDWINNGAKDMFGNTPQYGNMPPQIIGFVSPGGSAGHDARTIDQPLELDSTDGIVDIYVAYYDDQTPSTSFASMQYKIAEVIEDLNTAPLMNFTSGSYSAKPLEGSTNISYTHKFSIDTRQYRRGAGIFFKAVIQETTALPTIEIPNDVNKKHYLQYFSIKIN